MLDEIFSFQMTSTEDGPGRGGVMQHGYDLAADGETKLWDEVNVIEKNNTAVALPSGYHTTVALPVPAPICCGAWQARRRSTKFSSMNAIPGWRAACIKH